MSTQIESILRNRSLRLTSARKAILQIFLNETEALSHQMIEDRVGADVDRVTVYRTLKTFVDKGLLHRIIDDSEMDKYGLCHEHCGPDHHHDSHVHFQCEACGKTLCLEDTHVPTISLPKGYSGEQFHFLIKGKCNLCTPNN